LIPLLWGELKIAGVDATEPSASLLQDQAGQWNLIEALEPRQPEPEEPSKLIVLVESFHLRNAKFDVRPASGGGKLYRLQDLNLQGRVGVQPTGISLDVAELMTVLISSGQPDLRLRGEFEYEQAAVAPATVKVKNFWAVSRHSQVKLNGEFAIGEKMTVKAQASIEKLAAADTPTRAINRGAAHLCIVDPLGSSFTEKEGLVGDIFASHPPIRQRVIRLKGMAYQQGKQAGTAG